MRIFALTALIASFAAPVLAQEDGIRRETLPNGSEVIIIPDSDEIDDIIAEDEAAEASRALEDAEPEAPAKPDYSHLSPKAEQQARLDELFQRLQTEEDAEKAGFIAEDIWAVWLDSGSATVDLILRRAIATEKRGNLKFARRLYDQVTTLLPDYAEGWARSSSLALSEEDYNRAVNEAMRALSYEPRHFQAMWTLGKVLEKLGRSDDALIAYREAHELYPQLPSLKAHVDKLSGDVEGDVL